MVYTAFSFPFFFQASRVSGYVLGSLLVLQPLNISFVTR